MQAMRARHRVRSVWNEIFFWPWFFNHGDDLRSTEWMSICAASVWRRHEGRSRSEELSCDESEVMAAFHCTS